MRTYRPDTKSLIIITGLIISVSIILIVGVFSFFKLRLLRIVLYAVICAVSLFCILIYLPIYFKNTAYYIYSDSICRQSGVIFKKIKTVKFSSIRYTTFVTSFLSNISGFNFIIIYMYGGSMILLFLKKNDAYEILKKIGCEVKQ